MSNFAQALCRARKALGDTQKELGEMVGYAHPQRRISELERGLKKPGTAARRILENYIRQAELLDEHGYAARCPQCGAWNNNPTGRKQGLFGDPEMYDQVDEQECEKCGHRWWPTV